MAKLATQIQKNTQDLHDLKNAIEGVKGPMDQLIAEAERTGSAVANINGVMVEMVSLNQTNWQPSLQAVQWQLYETQKKSEETTKAVSRDILDQIVPLVDKHMPHFELWLKKILQMAADGEIGFDELKKKMDDWASSVGAKQLNTMYHDDIPGFQLAFRKLMQEIEDGKKPMSEAASFMDRIAGKARDVVAAVKEAVKTVAGMTKGSKGGAMGSSSSGSSNSTEGSGMTDTEKLGAAIKSLSGRVK